MPSHNYYRDRDLAEECLEKLDARDHLLDSYATVEKTYRLTRAFIEDGKKPFSASYSRKSAPMKPPGTKR